MNNLYLEAPNYANKFPNNSIFLAGSITGAWNWQEKVAKKLLPFYSVINPRRENFNALDRRQEEIQITWEHHYLSVCKNILFYFSHETLAPITLLELGAILESAKHLPFSRNVYICIHPEYKRKNYVIIQTRLRNNKYSKYIFDDLDLMTDIIIEKNLTFKI
jgi:hypothetical protein